MKYLSIVLAYLLHLPCSRILSLFQLSKSLCTLGTTLVYAATTYEFGECL
jgi:hypothetical protein